jgi:hypothetical protein
MSPHFVRFRKICDFIGLRSGHVLLSAYCKKVREKDLYVQVRKSLNKAIKDIKRLIIVNPIRSSRIVHLKPFIMVVKQEVLKSYEI